MPAPWTALLLDLIALHGVLAHQQVPTFAKDPPYLVTPPPPPPPPPPSPPPPVDVRRPLEVAAPPPPAPDPLLPLIPWTRASGDLLTWTPAVAGGPSAFAGRDFAGVGFNLGVGVHHQSAYDPNPAAAGAAVLASLGLLGLPRGLLLGNERGVELTSRVVWIGSGELLAETAIRPVSRVLRSDRRLSTPSVLGALAPAVGFTTLESKDAQPHAGLVKDYGAILFRWSFGLRHALVEAPVWVFVELEPTAQILVPADGSRSRGSLGLNLNAGFLPLVN